MDNVTKNDTGLDGDGVGKMEVEALCSSLGVVFTLDGVGVSFDPLVIPVIELLYMFERPIHFSDAASNSGV